MAIYVYLQKEWWDAKRINQMLVLFKLPIDKWFSTYGLWPFCVVYQIFIPIEITAMKYQQNNFVDECHQNIKNCIKKNNALAKLRAAILEYQYWCPLFDITFELYFYFQIVNTFHNAMHGGM